SVEPTPTVPGEDGSNDEPTDGASDGSGNADSTDGKQDDQTSGVTGSGSGPGTGSSNSAADTERVAESRDSSGWLANTGANSEWIAARGGLAIVAGMAMLIAKSLQQMQQASYDITQKSSGDASRQPGAPPDDFPPMLHECK